MGVPAGRVPMRLFALFWVPFWPLFGAVNRGCLDLKRGRHPIFGDFLKRYLSCFGVFSVDICVFTKIYIFIKIGLYMIWGVYLYINAMYIVEICYKYAHMRIKWS